MQMTYQQRQYAFKHHQLALHFSAILARALKWNHLESAVHLVSFILVGSCVAFGFLTVPKVRESYWAGQIGTKLRLQGILFKALVCYECGIITKGPTNSRDPCYDPRRTGAAIKVCDGRLEIRLKGAVALKQFFQTKISPEGFYAQNKDLWHAEGVTT